MPVDPDIEISAFAWVPSFAQGLVRDLRVRWALEEAGLPYRERLLDAMKERPEAYFCEQPFGQVPIYNEGNVHMFETGAIVLHIAERSDVLMPRDLAARARATSWVVAALSSIEPMIMELASIDLFNADAEWARARRPQAENTVRERLGRLSSWLGERDHLEDRFTAGDLMMTTMLRILRHTGLVSEHLNLARYQARCEARPAFQRALRAQLAVFEKHQPAETASTPSRREAMAYVEGFVAAVPAANKEAYRKHATDAASFFKELGVTRMVENWGDDVPDGKVTDFKGAVKAKPDEVVVFSWLEYPTKQVRDAANEKMMSDPRMKEMGAAMPFDGQRMIFGGFTPIVDERTGGRMGYADGALLAVPAGNKAAYRERAAKLAAVFKEHGATRVVEAWGDDVPDGKVTDYKRAVKATDDETVVYSWIEWPSKEARDQGWKKVMADPRMRPDKHNVLFDGKRMVHGGFAPILDV